MLLSVIIEAIFLFAIIFIYLVNADEGTQDETTTRPNTLYDDADDIQRQLDNEARDKMMFGKPKNVWVFRLPTEFPQASTKSWSRHTRKSNIFQRRTKTKSSKYSTPASKNWCYKDQNLWHKSYPQCGGRSQSPVNLPATGLVKAKGSRHLSFINYDIVPRRLTLNKNEKRIVLYGEWEYDHQPMVHGGAAFSRRYLFHSMILHWPSEHRIGGVQYPLETQILHISAEFKTLEEALAASSRDHQAVLGIANLYKYKNHTQRGLEELLNVARSSLCINASVAPTSLSFFNPPFKQYVCYQGSLTVPPCTETVLWLVRARALPVAREAAEVANSLIDGGISRTRVPLIRQPQPLNDRKVLYFH